jgi:hypothetical protein
MKTPFRQTHDSQRLDLPRELGMTPNPNIAIIRAPMLIHAIRINRKEMITTVQLMNTDYFGAFPYDNSDEQLLFIVFQMKYSLSWPLSGTIADRIFAFIGYNSNYHK